MVHIARQGMLPGMSDIAVRLATTADVRDVESVRVRSWKLAYRGLVPDDYLDALAVTDERVRLRAALLDTAARTWVAVDGEDVVGMAVCGPCRDDDLPDALELGALYVLASHWGSGAGHALLTACGPVETLWVLAGNARARVFYERHGFAPDGTSKDHPDLGAVDVRYRRPRLA